MYATSVGGWYEHWIGSFLNAWLDMLTTFVHGSNVTGGKMCGNIFLCVETILIDGQRIGPCARDAGQQYTMFLQTKNNI